MPTSKEIRDILIKRKMQEKGLTEIQAEKELIKELKEILERSMEADKRLKAKGYKSLYNKD